MGLHLNLSRGVPLDPAFPPTLLRDGGFDESLVGALPAEVVAAELEAQLARAEALLGQAPTHVDVHRHGIDNGWVLQEDPRAEDHWAFDGEGVVSSLYWWRDRQTIKRAELRSWIEARRAVLSGAKRE